MEIIGQPLIKSTHSPTFNSLRNEVEVTHILEHDKILNIEKHLINGKDPDS